ncbi:MAG: methionine--tRNA ligase, partial [Nitrospiraceae bacterium]|nr:methionine--tRNA ligase [Nitrospiraceae bacterium]
HIGHAYTTIAADVLARYYSQSSPHDVFFLTGVDEHGQKVQQAAAKAGIDPQRYCDSMVPRFRDLWERLKISNDAFIRTTDIQHKTVVQRYLQELFDKNLIYQDSYSGWYCTFDERFWTEKDVVEGLCPDCTRPVERLSESNYFFRMSEYQKRLLDHMKAHPGLADNPASFIRPPSRFNEVLSFLEKQQLENLSISRPISRLSWGIKLPFDPNYVTYVWFDALVNYISALEYLNPNGTKYWPTPGNTDHTVIHLVGKDILTTHAVYWSTMLMALGFELPTTIFAHGWWTVNGEKMSKSRGNVVDPNRMIDEFGSDAFRYFLLREVPFGQDGDFSREALIGRFNSELADGLGNLLSRTLTMIARFAEGKIPPSIAPKGELDNHLEQRIGELTGMARTYIRDLRFNRALESMWELIQQCDQYIDKTAPWTLAKRAEDRDHLHGILHRVARALEFLIPVLYPFMPETAAEVARQLGLNPQLQGRRLVLRQLTPGVEIAKGKPLFPRIDITKTQGARTVSDTPTHSQPNAATPAPATPTAQTPAPAAPAPVAPAQITIDEFQKIQLKTAKVLTAERVPKSEKLLKLQVSLGEGTEPRQIVAGIGKKYEPEALIGKTIVIVANLKPAKLMGVESQGMVLAAGDSEVRGLVTILEEVDPGTKVK